MVARRPADRGRSAERPVLGGHEAQGGLTAIDGTGPVRPPLGHGDAADALDARRDGVGRSRRRRVPRRPDDPRAGRAGRGAPRQRGGALRAERHDGQPDRALAPHAARERGHRRRRRAHREQRVGRRRRLERRPVRHGGERRVVRRPRRARARACAARDAAPDVARLRREHAQSRGRARLPAARRARGGRGGKASWPSRPPRRRTALERGGGVRVERGRLGGAVRHGERVLLEGPGRARGVPRSSGRGVRSSRRARRFRKMLGGGVRQGAGILAAACTCTRSSITARVSPKTTGARGASPRSSAVAPA